MKKFTVKFQREFEVEVEADSLETAEQLARQVLLQFPPQTAKLLSILPEGYIEPVAPPPQLSPPRGRPLGGGSSGPTIVRVPVLIDQIAKVA